MEEGNIDMAGYLWRFYVIQNRFTDAAYVLSELADAPGYYFNYFDSLALILKKESNI